MACGVEEILVAAHCIVESRKHLGMVYCGMVWQHVDKHLYTVFESAVAHCLEVLSGTEHIVADGPVGRLVVVVPFTFNAVAGLAEQSHSSVFTHVACLHGRCLNVVVAGIGNGFHVVGNSVERPRPSVENNLVAAVGGRLAGKRVGSRAA